MVDNLGNINSSSFAKEILSEGLMFVFISGLCEIANVKFSKLPKANDRLLLDVKTFLVGYRRLSSVTIIRVRITPTLTNVTF